MILATRIVLLIVCALFFLATMSDAHTERRGYLYLTCAVAAASLLLLSYRIT